MYWPIAKYFSSFVLCNKSSIICCAEKVNFPNTAVEGCSVRKHYR